jgi:hypothetical protein
MLFPDLVFAHVTLESSCDDEGVGPFPLTPSDAWEARFGSDPKETLNLLCYPRRPLQ